MAIPIVIGGSVYLCQKSDPGLSVKFEHLFDALFKDLAINKNPAVIFSELMVKGVVDESGAIKSSVVEELSKTDEIIEYKGRYYSETELDLYSLAFLVHEEDVLLLKGYDLVGNNYDSFKVSSAKECLQACELTSKCTGFTYAKATHPNLSKRNKCWLNNKSVKYKVDNNYVSGTR